MTSWRVAAAPGALPVLGQVLHLRKGLVGFLTWLSAHGDLVEIRLGTWRGYLVCHPDLAEQVLLDDRTFDKGGPMFDKIREVTGNGIVTCPHHEHSRQRQLTHPAFGHDRLPGYARVMAEQISIALDGWREGPILDAILEMNALASRVTTRTLFTDESADEAAGAVEECFDDLSRGIYRHLITPWRLLERVPTPANRGYRRALVRTRAAVAEAVTGHQRAAVDHADLLSALLSARDDDDRPLGNGEAEAQVMTLLSAGIGTTATALVWALHLIASHPDVQEQLHDEAEDVLGGRDATVDDLPKLELTSRVLTETLRLYPPIWVVTRTITTPTELGGHRLPAGTNIVHSPYLVHRRPDCFAEPERFDPDRWLTDRASPLARHAYQPFGTGARSCVAENYAMTFASLALASIVGRWRVQPATPAPPRIAPRLTLTPRALPLRLHRH